MIDVYNLIFLPHRTCHQHFWLYGVSLI